jgi:hypothetical protein
MIYTIKKSNMKRIILITILLGITMTATANQPLITHKLHNNFDISTYYQQLDSVQNRVLPLIEEKELSILYYLIAARLCISLTQSAYNASLSTDNAHHFITEKPAWKLIYQLIHRPIKI